MNYLKDIIRISLPALGGFLGLILFEIVDIFWIGKVGVEAIAGVAAAGFIIWSLYAVMTVTNGGASSLIARYNGAGDKEKTWEAVVQATGFSVLIGLITMVLVIPNVEWIFEAMGLTSDTSVIAIKYFRILVFGYILIYLDMLSSVVFNAYGDNNASMVIMFLSLVANMVLDPIMIFGWWGCPAWGVEGAAYATLTGHLLSLTLRVIVLKKKGYIPPFRKFLTLRHSMYGKMAAIGIPGALTSLVWSIIYPVLTTFITRYGDIHVSAVGICHRLEDFPFYAGTAIGIAMTTLTANAVGRNDRKSIDKIAFTGLMFGTLVSLPFMLAFVYYGAPMIKLFSSEDQVLIQSGAEYLKIVGYSEILMSWELIIGGIFTGIGVTYPMLWISIPLTLARIPGAWFLSEYCGMGVNGIWLAISASTALKGLGLAILYLINRKKLKLV